MTAVSELEEERAALKDLGEEVHDVDEYHVRYLARILMLIARVLIERLPR